MPPTILARNIRKHIGSIVSTNQYQIAIDVTFQRCESGGMRIEIIIGDGFHVVICELVVCTRDFRDGVGGSDEAVCGVECEERGGIGVGGCGVAEGCAYDVHILLRG